MGHQLSAQIEVTLLTAGGPQADTDALREPFPSIRDQDRLHKRSRSHRRPAPSWEEFDPASTPPRHAPDVSLRSSFGPAPAPSSPGHHPTTPLGPALPWAPPPAPPFGLRFHQRVFSTGCGYNTFPFRAVALFRVPYARWGGSSGSQKQELCPTRSCVSFPGGSVSCWRTCWFAGDAIVGRCFPIREMILRRDEDRAVARSCLWYSTLNKNLHNSLFYREPLLIFVLR